MREEHTTVTVHAREVAATRCHAVRLGCGRRSLRRARRRRFEVLAPLCFRNPEVCTTRPLLLSTFTHDTLAESSATGITGTGEIWLSDAVWYDGEPFDPLLKAVEYSGHCHQQRHPKCVAKIQLFSKKIAKKKTKFRQTRASRGELWNTYWPPGAKAFQFHSRAAEGSNIGSRGVIKEQPDRLRTHMVTSTQHLTTDSDELVTVDFLLACIF